MDPLDTRSFNRAFSLPNGNVLEISFQEGVYKISILDHVLREIKNNQSDLISFDTSRDIHLKFPAFRDIRFERQSLPSEANLTSSIPQNVGVSSFESPQMISQQIPAFISNHSQSFGSSLRSPNGKPFYKNLPGSKYDRTINFAPFSSTNETDFLRNSNFGRKPPVGSKMYDYALRQREVQSFDLFNKINKPNFDLTKTRLYGYPTQQSDLVYSLPSRAPTKHYGTM